MRVRDLLAVSELGLDIRVSGQLDRPIRWVHTIEIPEPGRFLNGGEVTLTAGVWRSAGVRTEDFVADLAAAGVAAVGFGIVPPETEVPEQFVAAARSAGLTCFVVPVRVAFLQVVEAFVNSKRIEWERPLRRHLDQYDAIVAALRSNRGVSSVLDVLSRQIGMPMAVRLSGELVAGTSPEHVHPVPLVGESIADAELLLPGPLGELDVERHAAVVQAMPFLALEIERDRAIRATDLQYAWELFAWVRGGVTSMDTIRTRLHTLGLPPDGPLAGIVVRTEQPEADAARLGEFLGGDGVAVRREEHVIAFARIRTGVAERAQAVYEALGAESGRVRHIGAGEAGDAAELRVSLLQAGYAADAVSAQAHGGWMTHEALASPALLLSVQEPEMLAATSRALLGPVLEYERRRGGDLLVSLETFLEAGGRWQEAAKQLHVHINTLRHRIGRVEELTGRSLTHTPDRVDLYLALRAVRGK